MKTIHSRHIIALVGLLIFLITGQAGVQGYVWCIGENGHAAMEYAAGTSCAPETRGKTCNQDQGSDPSALTFSDANCIDLPTTLEAAPSQSLTEKSFQPAVTAIPGSSILPASGILAHNHHFQPPYRISQTILAHRTVVLLN